VNSPYLTTKEIAEKLGFSSKAVSLWIKDGKLKAFKFGKDYRIRQEDFEEFLKQSTVNTTQSE
jgi:excisionase family DNA binding protein